MNLSKKDRGPELSRSRRILFNSILVIIIPFLLFLLTELFLRVIHYGQNYDLFMDFPEDDFKEYRFINPEIGMKYFRVLNYNRPAGDMFLKKKPENGFRIFVLGSSTALGFPYDQNLMFSRILEERLRDGYPEKKVEVINTAITAINSFTLLDYAKDILKEEPDAVLIYAGHNEFYGALGVGSVEKAFNSRSLTLLHLDLMNLKVYQLVSNLITSVSNKVRGNNTEGDVKGTLMKRIAKNREIPYKSETYKRGIRYYRENMNQLLEAFTNKGIPVFYSDICSNIKDLPPFCSAETDAFPPASGMYEKALRQEADGNYADALESFVMAKDLDCIRFRAPEEINGIIHELAGKKGVRLVPTKSDYFEKESPHRLIGNNLMTEHVHPNIGGIFLLADAFYHEITASEIMGEIPGPVRYKSSDYYRRNWGYTELDSLAALHGVNLLKTNWPFRSIESSSEAYRKEYKPVSFVDSLAFTVATSAYYPVYEAHDILAEYYLNKGLYYLAFKEYYANVKFDPFQVNYYNDAIHCLVFTHDFPLALQLTKRSLELKETFYARFILGEILFLKGDYPGAINEYNRAADLDKSMQAKLQVLMGLHKVFYYSGRTADANRVLIEIQKIRPEFSPLYPKEKKDYVYYIPIQVEKLVDEAYNFYRARDFDKALPLFKKSLESKETSLANRCIGDILFTRNDSAALIYYQKALPDYRNNINFLFNLGILYTQYKLKEEAETVLQDIRKLDPNYARISYLVEAINKIN